jgi:adenosylcobinamide-GDP ribazoletransferase
MRAMTRRLLGAIQFLTIVPVRTRTASIGASTLFFPVVGAAIGAGGGLLLETWRGYIPFSLLAFLVLVVWILVSGGLHEDGFARCADAFQASRSAGATFEQLYDRCIGTRGVVGLVLLLVIRWQALSSIAVDPVPALAAALALSRSAAVGLLWSTPPVGNGTAARASETLSTPTALAAIAFGILFVLLLPGGRIASILVGSSTALVLLARAYFIRRMGGVTGHCLGAITVLVETWCLIVYTCQPCTL